jgi:hypothetical protein
MPFQWENQFVLEVLSLSDSDFEELPKKEKKLILIKRREEKRRAEDKKQDQD